MNVRTERELRYMSELKKIRDDVRVLDEMARAISSGERIEILATREGVKILRVRKKELNTNPPQ